jgi:hypothetical protein
MSYTVRIKGGATSEQFEALHAAVMATSPNSHNIADAIAPKPALVIE